MLTQEQVLDEFRAAGALLEGHFILSSGLHSPRYLQCARVLMDAARADRLCSTLAAKVREAGFGQIDLVVSPAMGGVVVGYEMGRQLGVPAISAVACFRMCSSSASPKSAILGRPVPSMSTLSGFKSRWTRRC